MESENSKNMERSRKNPDPARSGIKEGSDQINLQEEILKALQQKKDDRDRSAKEQFKDRDKVKDTGSGFDQWSVSWP